MLTSTIQNYEKKPLSNEKGHILIVDDEENILSSMEAILCDEGYTISKACDGEMALRIIDGIDPDIVLLDIWIPGMDGIQTLKAIKKINPDVEIIMMSGHGTIETAVKATKMGAFDFIEKPLSMESLLSVVKAAFQKIRNISSYDSLRSGRVMKIIGESESMMKVSTQTKIAAGNTKNVLIYGERGTGKRFMAGIIFQESGKRNGHILSIKSEEFNESTSTDKRVSQKGATVKEKIEAKLEQAKGGTIILERVDRMSLEIQEILLSVIKEDKVNNKVQSEFSKAYTRFIATSDVNLSEYVKKKEFNEDLFNYLAEIAIYLPTLRERKGLRDIILYFIDEFSEEYGRLIEGIDDEALNLLISHDWKRNLEELKALIEQMVIIEREKRLTLKTVSLILPDKNIFPQNDVKNKNIPVKGQGIEQLKCFPEKQKNRIEYRRNKKGTLQKQQTLRSSVVLCGQGLHSGLKTGMILSPMPQNTGILFGDISTGETIPAHIDYVKSSQFATTLKKGTHSVKTIEHVMAVLHMYGITNLLIKMGDEVPIMDGSAVDFCQLIEDGGIEEQEYGIDEIVIDKEINITINGKSLIIVPSDTFSVSYYMDYPYPIGVQSYEFKFNGSEAFKKEVAPARTFGFVKDIEKMEEMGLGSGGKLSNIILVDEDKVINTSLRFENEFARHKVLDIIGDFYLLGHPIRGHIKAKMTGHTENINMVKKIQTEYRS